MSKINKYHKWLFHKDYTKWTFPIINRLCKKAVFKIFEVTNVWVNVTTITGDYSRWFYSRWSQKNCCLKEVLKNVFNEKSFSCFLQNQPYFTQSGTHFLRRLKICLSVSILARHCQERSPGVLQNQRNTCNYSY